MSSSFTQEPPTLDNQYAADRVLRSVLADRLPTDVHEAITPSLQAMGERAGGELYDLQQSDLRSEPTLTRWGPWGSRVDQIEVTDVWKRAETIAATDGVVAAAYEQRYGRFSRIYQMALAYLFIPSTDMYGCPLAMTDGAARTLLDKNDGPLADDVVPHLASRDPDTFWTSGQWMTELAGGSDVGQARTTARPDADGTWRLYGRKWFTSAINANMALALARPEGNPAGGAGLALFYVPIRTDGGLRDGIYVNRLKDKLGTRKLPTAELHLDGVVAHPVTDDLRDGTRHIAPMLNVTRTWNAVTAAALLRRGIALARDYAHKRTAFGKNLIEHPLHQETLADMQAVLEGTVHLAFRPVELLGRVETGTASASHKSLLRLLTPIAKLTTAKRAVAQISEVLEAFGGAGYVEDTGLPALLRDAQVLPIWEGTTNVLALDLLRALHHTGGLAPLRSDAQRCLDALSPPLREVVQPAEDALAEAGRWWSQQSSRSSEIQEAHARRLALTLGASLEVLYTARHAQWALDTQQDARSAAATERLAARRLNALVSVPHRPTAPLARDSSALSPSHWQSPRPASSTGEGTPSGHA
ncbi:MAG: acyl-CoA dehydrogenase family protein [Salinivenus sp.]